jgi:SOS-response transcriptional repressor LexA
MIIYKNTVGGFKDDVDSNHIVEKIRQEMLDNYGRRVAPNEERSWHESLGYMERVVRRSDVANDCGVLVEYMIPSTSNRVDFIIAGHDEDNNDNFIIVELKQWQKANSTEKDGVVRTFINGGERDVTHPSYQAFSYKAFLKDYNEDIESGCVSPYSCAVLHNYVEQRPEPLRSKIYDEIINDTPIYFKDDQEKLEKFINKYVGKGKGLDILYKIESGKIKPTKKLIDYVSGLFKGNKEFVLLDEQKIAFETAVSIIKNNVDEKSVLIIKGGPGTGKSVISMNLLGEFLNNDLNVKFVAPNSSFRDVMIESLAKTNSRVRLKSLFKGSAGFLDVEENTFDVIIVDEAHRLKNGMAYQYLGDNQVEDIIKASKKTIFFIDDNQVIRPEDIGSTIEVKRVADKLNAKLYEVELVAQFRCAGAEGYINWLDHVLQIRDTANFDGWDKKDFDFRVFDNPRDLYEEIKLRHSEGKKARLLAGYAWKWTSADEGNGNSQVCDVEVPEFDFKLPWNSRTSGTTWAIDESGISQVGCIHTSQGLEFDYVGVIVGDDLKFDPVSFSFKTDWKSYKDIKGKQSLKNNPEKLNKLVRNIYKILMTRGMKGCYVYFTDKETEKYFKSRMKKIVLAQKIEITTKKVIPSPYSGIMVDLPLFESVGCGPAMFANTIPEEMIAVRKDYLSGGSKYFVLRVTGDSMNKTGINDGDLVLCRKDYHPENGNRVVAQIGDDATIKEYYNDGKTVTLKPCSDNPKHQPLTFTDNEEMKVLGVVVRVLEREE